MPGAPTSPRGERAVTLDLSGVSPFGQLAWIHLAHLAAESAGVPATVVVEGRGLSKDIRQGLESEEARRGWPRLRIRELPQEPSEGAEFAFVAGSGALGVKLLVRMPRVHVAPAGPPVGIDPRIYWEHVPGGRFRSGLKALMAAVGIGGLGQELDPYVGRVAPARKTVSLLTSVFQGDEFLAGFLQNCAQLEGYGDCEHFLVRPGSPGAEHQALVSHVRQWPSAVYINLQEDPGLYPVWNWAARLSGGPYLSNANLDDRRAPGHVARLKEWLDTDPTIGVVSSALRVTETPNLNWGDAPEGPVWYGDQGDRTYTAEALLKATRDGFRSHNRPHCMPVWRRHLHACNGYFDESAFGPSADWEFWLRVGLNGARFGLLGRPLGLFLKHQASYWRRSGHTRLGPNDRRIVATYQPPLWEGRPSEAPRPPVARLVAEIRELEAQGAWGELLGRLLALGQRLTEEPAGVASRALGEALWAHYLGINDFLVWARSDPRGVISSAAGNEGLVRALIDILHYGPGRLGHRRSDVLRVLRRAAIDLYVLTEDLRALIAVGLIDRWQGRMASELAILEAARQESPLDFWPALQAVYRFEVPLDELVRRLGLMWTAHDAPAGAGAQTRLCYFPDFTANNPYQQLLYQDLEAAGARVEPVANGRNLLELVPETGSRTILHIHWIQAFFEGVPPALFPRRAAKVLALVRRLQGRGIAVYWTVHNRVSHAPISEHDELAFRRELAGLVDRVYLHHPMIRHELDWLPGDRPTYLVEHGAFPATGWEADRSSARRSLGLAESQFVLAHIGRVRPYKGLEETFPALRAFLQGHTQARFVVAGRMEADMAARLRGLSDQQAVVRKGFLSEEDLQHYVSAADYVLLSYREILTSGSLFYVLSSGRPVIAPRVGTIPAYVVDGWNGFLFSDPAELESILKALPAQPSAYHEELARNSRDTASSLEWKFW